MLGLYLFAAVLGGGLLLFSMLGGGDDAGHDHDVGGHGHDAGPGHGTHHGAGELLVGLFRPRNLIFFLATFGLTGSLLTLFGRFPPLTFALSAAMGLGAMGLSHALFLWLKRSDSAVDALGETDLEGLSARVVLPLAEGQPGRVVCLAGGREHYLTARLSPDTRQAIATGREVVILRMNGGVAEVAPFDNILPPSTDE